MRDDIWEILTMCPGLSGASIHRELVRRSRPGRWFGKDSFLAALFGPSIGGMYVTLYRMEREGILASQWGVATPERGGHRPRLYYIHDSQYA